MYFTTPKPYAIFVLGAGGTGSWLCAFLDKQSQGNNVIVMDGDVVEDKNILRQNFTRKDISRQKAQVVAAEHNMSYIHGYITDTAIFHQINVQGLVVQVTDYQGSSPETVSTNMGSFYLANTVPMDFCALF